MTIPSVFEPNEISRASELISEGRVGAPMTVDPGSDEPNPQKKREITLDSRKNTKFLLVMLN
jgi:hypothetical protein